MVRFGVLGAGRIGNVHAQTLANSGRASVAYIADAMPDAANALAGKVGARVASVADVIAAKDDDAILIAERVRRAFESVVIETGQESASTTVSIGIAATSFAVDVPILLAAADAAVYEAKARGRNRVIVAEPSTLLRSQDDTIPLRRRA